MTDKIEQIKEILKGNYLDNNRELWVNYGVQELAQQIDTLYQPTPNKDMRERLALKISEYYTQPIPPKRRPIIKSCYQIADEVIQDIIEPAIGDAREEGFIACLKATEPTVQSYYEGIIAKLEKERDAAIKEIGVQARQAGKLESQLASKDAEIKEFKEYLEASIKDTYYFETKCETIREKTLKTVGEILEKLMVEVGYMADVYELSQKLKQGKL
jgi:hypothetical protein